MLWIPWDGHQHDGMIPLLLSCHLSNIRAFQTTGLGFMALFLILQGQRVSTWALKTKQNNNNNKAKQQQQRKQCKTALQLLEEIKVLLKWLFELVSVLWAVDYFLKKRKITVISTKDNGNHHCKRCKWCKIARVRGKRWNQIWPNFDWIPYR